MNEPHPDANGNGAEPGAVGRAGGMSLEGMHGSVEVPHHQAGFWRHWRAFIGPAILVSVGYMDPGNWGTDLAAGAQYKYGLLWVVGLASLMAIFMQVISSVSYTHLRVAAQRGQSQSTDWRQRSGDAQSLQRRGLGHGQSAARQRGGKHD